MHSRGVNNVIFAACWMILIGSASSVRAQDDGDAQARAADHVESTREILDGGFVGSNHPWYSSEADDATLIPLAPPQTQSTGDPWYQFIIDFFKWLAEPVISFDFLGRTYEINMLMIIMVLIILTPIVWFLIKLYRNRANNADLSGTGQTEDGERTDADRVEALPFEIKPADNLLDVALKFANSGRYGDAIIYLFSHRLVELDRSHIIRLTKGKTNRQYLREMKLAELRLLMEQSTIAFEDAFFGHYEIGKARFQECWDRNDEFRALAMRGRAYQ